MKKMVSIVSLFLIFLVISFCLIGTRARATTGEDELDFVRLKMYVTGSWPQRDTEVIQQEINKYLRKKINAEIEIVGIHWTAWWQRIPLILHTGEQVDILFTASWEMFYDHVAKGFLLPLDKLLNVYGQGIKENLPEILLNGVRIDGELYAIPSNKEIAESDALYFRKDLLDKYQLDISSIEKVNDLEPILKVIKENEPNIVPIWMYAHTLSRYVEPKDKYIPIAGVNRDIIQFNTETGQVVNILETEKRRELYRLFHRWYEQGYINRDAPTTRLRADDAVLAGKSFMTYGPGKPGGEDEKETLLGMELEKVVFDKPRITTNSITGSMLAIPVNSRYPERAMMLLNLLHTDKYLVNLFAYGIEGRHYVKTERENIIRLPQGVDSLTEAGYGHGVQWIFGNQFLQYIFENENPQKWELIRKYNQNARISPLLGFRFNPERVQAEIAAIQNIREEFHRLVESGAFEVDLILNRYLEQLNANGLNKVIKEVQNQYEAWKKINK